jgi:hypothetical protein
MEFGVLYVGTFYVPMHAPNPIGAQPSQDYIKTRIVIAVLVYCSQSKVKALVTNY